MDFTTRDLQARLAALGFNPGPIDGLRGRRTNGAAKEAMSERGVTSERALFACSGLHRIHWHWTAGKYGVIKLERDHYNGLIAADGSRVAGKYPPEGQAKYRKGKGVSHTRKANTGAIGLSMDCMAGAAERPFNPGSAPMTWDQVHGLVDWTAELCLEHDIPVSPYSTLSHAEVQPTLGIQQRWKWDITWLPDMARPGDAIAVGNRLRAMVAERIVDLGGLAA